MVGARLDLVKAFAQFGDDAVEAVQRVAMFGQLGGGLRFVTLQSDHDLLNPRQAIFKIGKAGIHALAEKPTLFEMVVNMKTAKALGIKVPQIVLLQANRLIE